MTLSTFDYISRDVGCKLCPLWEGCKSVCIPTREWRDGDPNVEEDALILLILGEAPGYSEDRQDKVFIGKSGNLLTKLYLPELDGHAQIHLGNAVRCFPGSGVTPPPKSVTACKVYLERDIYSLSGGISGNVIVLAVGSTAATTIAGHRTVKEALKHQGEICRVGEVDVQVFYTYHPAAVLRNPSLFFAVRAHLHMVRRALQGKPWMVRVENLEITINGSLPVGLGAIP